MSYRLSLTIPSLALGGAESFVSRLASHWAAAGHHVRLITLDIPANDSYSLDAGVERVTLDGMQSSSTTLRGLWNNYQRIRRLRSEFRNHAPQCVISFLESMNVISVLASRSGRWPVVISERTHPRHHRVRGIWSILRDRTYPRAQRLVVQTESVRDWMEPVMSGRPIHVIGNGVRSFGTRGQAEREKLILGVGRLSSEKGFDRTIAAFAELANEAPDWKLVIIGEGPKRSELERQISDLQLDERIQLPGFQESVAEWYQRASIFVLSSSYEGFPNALLEAMAAGCAVIAADCESGPSEIVRHEIDGWLIPPSNREALTVRLRDAIRNPELCRELGIRAKNVTDRFSMESCFDAWDALIAESIKSGRSA